MAAFPTSCSNKYLLKNCECLADPMDVYSNVCAYISKQNGLLYPCDPGCCKFSCENKDPNISRREVRPAYGVTLPNGFGNNLQQSDDPSEFPGTASFVTTDASSPGNPYPLTPLLPVVANSQTMDVTLPVWKILLIALIPFLVMILSSCYL
jgi:hypothetical protein